MTKKYIVSKDGKELMEWYETADCPHATYVAIPSFPKKLWGKEVSESDFSFEHQYKPMLQDWIAYDFEEDKWIQSTVNKKRIIAIPTETKEEIGVCSKMELTEEKQQEEVEKDMWRDIYETIDDNDVYIKFETVFQELTKKYHITRKQ